MDMQQKPLVVSISAERGRDHLAGITTQIVDAVLDTNPHLQFVKAENRHNGPYLTERNIYFRPVEAAE